MRARAHTHERAHARTHARRKRRAAARTSTRDAAPLDCTPTVCHLGMYRTHTRTRTRHAQPPRTRACLRARTQVPRPASLLHDCRGPNGRHEREPVHTTRARKRERQKGAHAHTHTRTCAITQGRHAHASVHILTRTHTQMQTQVRFPFRVAQAAQKAVGAPRRVRRHAPDTTGGTR